ncbi:MAG TPA: acyl-ACP--UDP-N-acetylglucosamine O-acyltransferase, partial [candidate division Zixibacteria bacterium]|nr:acyl-ACP--UDP-N-acetylglucosamine O-acyltransferase [candidate division Zixibacteria bacterium]
EAGVAEAMIHPTAMVSPKARLAPDVEIGPYTVIADDVEIGPKTKIAASCFIDDGARIGAEVQIFHGAVVSGRPQDLKYAGEKSCFFVWDKTIIREFVTLHRGTSATGKSTVGKNCLLMAYAHVAHDCRVGDNVIMANVAQLGGHVKVGNWAIIGGGTVVHQFCKVGAHVMVGGGFRIAQDLVPYALAADYPLRVVGINKIGLERRGFPKDTIAVLERAFRYLFRSKLNTSQAVEKIKAELDSLPEIKELLDFIAAAERGLVK